MSEFERKMKERAAKFNQASTTISTNASIKPPQPVSPIASIQPKPIVNVQIQDTMTAKQKYEQMLQQSKSKEAPSMPKPIAPTIQKNIIAPTLVSPIQVEAKPVSTQPSIPSQPNKAPVVQISPNKPVSNIEETKKLDTEKLKDIYKNMPLFATKSSQKSSLHSENISVPVSNTSEGVKLFKPSSNKKTKQFKFDTEGPVVEGFSHLQINASTEPQNPIPNSNKLIEPYQANGDTLIPTQNTQNAISQPVIESQLADVQLNAINQKERKFVDDAFEDDDINAMPEPNERIVLDEHELEDQKEGMAFTEEGVKSEDQKYTVPKFGVEPKQATPKLDPLSMMKFAKDKDEMIEL